MKGYYIIGVYGKETTTYSLVVTENDKMLIEVYGGKPFSLNMNS